MKSFSQVKCVLTDLESLKGEELNQKLQELGLKALKSGDALVVEDDYRQSNISFFMKEEGESHILHPESSAGYMNIPLECTKLFDNAIEHYRDLFEFIEWSTECIMLRGSDGWIRKKFNFEFPEDYVFVVQFIGDEDSTELNLHKPMEVEILEEKGEEIVNMVESSKKPQTKLELIFNAEGETYDELKDKFGHQMFNIRCQDIGFRSRSLGASGGTRKRKSTFEFQGPADKRLILAQRIVSLFYKYPEVVKGEVELLDRARKRLNFLLVKNRICPDLPKSVSKLFLEFL